MKLQFCIIMGHLIQVHAEMQVRVLVQYSSVTFDPSVIEIIFKFNIEIFHEYHGL